ncbi:bifunctional metallophosphatase/5'-nucleotidase [Anaerosacchariphilus polymeriproducens]|uniref:Bifunctional metallophosphatase/5'-nucleotidase n=1 Tax=Anaerosacchariphilus polymeriproducens TaxID=1812858 RepID=A0A371AVD7_9FIRM|nr:bifunctional UDP-sugar hydrolase/5'-nucleotidase [Anaerosacchariphilus polymeriproducens]RDU23440.1 bifunctional metallophosphatase/5'-nucleotidase [Anaerosacchariphilus polymeriproducens]
MKKNIKLFLSCLIVIGLVLFPISVSKSSAGQQDKKITILFTHDLHDNFLPLKTEKNGEVEKCGGFARLQTAIKEQKKLDEEALLLDAGDFSMGTPFQTIFRSDAPELSIMGEMGYDVVTLGNHEFDYRATGLAESLEAAKKSGGRLPQLVQSNISYPKDKQGNLTDTLLKLKHAMEEYGAKEYTVLERNGVRVGIFGIMGEGSASMAPMSEVQFKDPIKHAKQKVQILKEQEKVDFIICLSHSGTDKDASKSEDEILAKKVPDINLIISGHTHTKLSEPIVVGDTVIGSCEDSGKNLGIVQFSQKESKNWKMDHYDLRGIDDKMEEDKKISDRIKSYKKIVQEKYFDQFRLKCDEVLAQSSFYFDSPKNIIKHHQESLLGNFISDSYIYAVKKAEGKDYIPVSAAIVPAGTIRGTFFQGDITVWDAFNVSSLGMGADNLPGYPLISVYLTGKELKTVCEVDASITPIMKEAQLFLSGMNFTFNPNRFIFNKVIKTILVNEEGTAQEIEDEKLYRVAAGLYSAQMLSVVGEKSHGLLKIQPKTKDGNPITDFESQIIYDNSDGKKTEVKEWYAIVEYLKSFEQKDGISQIPERYNRNQERKVVDNSKNILALLQKPNHITVVVYVLIVVILTLIIVVVMRIVKKIKRKKTVQ